MNVNLFILTTISIFICYGQLAVTIKTTEEPNDLTTLDVCTAIGNGTCDDCISNENCFFCKEDNTCRPYKLSGIFPEGCAASKARWFNCSIDFQALLIAVITVGTVLLIAIITCLFCCFNRTCRAIGDAQYKRAQAKFSKRTTERLAKNKEKREERQVKNDQIRAKYGLQPTTYVKLEA